MEDEPKYEALEEIGKSPATKHVLVVGVQY
jgi:hypothetical protein